MYILLLKYINKLTKVKLCFKTFHKSSSLFIYIDSTLSIPLLIYSILQITSKLSPVSNTHMSYIHKTKQKSYINLYKIQLSGEMLFHLLDQN